MSVATCRFAVESVQPARDALREVPARSWVELTAGRLEMCDLGGANYVLGPGCHTLLMATHLAFQGHRSLVLSPDMIWLTLLQGLQNHLLRNAEQLRPKFVEHAGRRLLSVRCDDLSQSAALFEDFHCQIQEHLRPEASQRLNAIFSTTGLVERIAARINQMGICANYFEYEVFSLCGIPHIVLEGTPADWTLLRQTIAGWNYFELEDWTVRLDEILSQFESAARGDVHPHFWKNIYRNGGSQRSGGGPLFDGWIGMLYPYLLDPDRKRTRFNPLLKANQTFLQPRPSGPISRDSEITLRHSSIPDAISQAPFRWTDLASGQTHNLYFVSGLTGVEQDPQTLALRPRIGWGIRRAENPKPPEIHPYIQQINRDSYENYCTNL